MSASGLRVLIVDDEPLARERLRDLLEQERDVVVVGESGDGREAVELIRAHAPDLVFLDIQMPELDGFAVIAELDERTMPAVIFVTAYDRYALRAFDVHALDYVLKPFDRERFQKALAHARQIVEGGLDAFRTRVLELLAERVPQKQPEYLQRFMVRTGGRIYFVPVDDVDWIEAAGNYVKLHVGNEAHLLRDSLSSMDERLDPARFARIHRSCIVNVERIRMLEPLYHGDYSVQLKDGTRLTLSRHFREGAEQRLGGRL